MFKLRNAIVSTFEVVCELLVVVPTVLVLIVSALTNDSAIITVGVITAAGTFVVSAFLAGGALTLVSIAENTRETVRVLKQLDAKLQSTSIDVGRIESAWRETRNEAAIGAATSPPNA